MKKPVWRNFSMNKLIPKYQNPSSTLLPRYEYEWNVIPKGVSVEKHERITNEDDWQKYWGNEGAKYVNKAQNKAAPYVIQGMSMLMGNPIAAAGSIVGGMVGEELGAKVGGPSRRAIGGLVGSVLLDPVNIRQGMQIGKNIANRNMFAYKYIRPISYGNPINRGITYAKHLLTDQNLPNVNNIPNYWKGTPWDGYMSKFRDDAWRKYLGLPERTGIYKPNKDGTFSYDLSKIKKISPTYASEYTTMVVPEEPTVIGDWVTGNGGNVKSTFDNFGNGIGSDATKTFGMQHLSDLWDIQPLSRYKWLPSSSVKNQINKAQLVANNIYMKLFEPLYRSRFGYNYLGGRALNKFRYTSAYEKPIENLLKPLDNLTKKVKNFEIGPLVKGKPFQLETDIPVTKGLKETDNGMIRTTDVGFTNENIMPQGYFDYMQYNTPIPELNFNNITQ